MLKSKLKKFFLNCYKILRLYGLAFRAWGLDLGFSFWGLGFRAYGLRFITI
jgi:hypothetical protein